MKIFRLNSADYIKGIIIDFLLLKDRNVVIGNEVMYGTERRLVDLVLLKDKRITAIEIKSDNDNLKRIKEQIAEYKKIFNYVVLVVTKKHLDKILEISSNDIGIYLIHNDSTIELIRSPRLQREIEKYEILYSINARYLKKIVEPLHRTLSADELRNHLEKKRSSYLQEVFFKYLDHKISSSFKFFLSERGCITHIEDLGILSSSRNLIE